MARARRTRTDEAGMLISQRSAGVAGPGMAGSTSTPTALSASISKTATGSSALQHHPRDIRQPVRSQQPVLLQRVPRYSYI